MTWDKLDSNISSRDTIIREPLKTKKQEQPPQNIPVVKETTPTDDADKPVEGFYMEKTSQPKAANPLADGDNDDDDGNDDVDPNKRLPVDSPIAICDKTTSDITDTMQQTFDCSMAQVFSPGETSYVNAQEMLKNNNAYKFFNEFEFDKNKKLNIFAKTVGEGIIYNIVSDNASISMYKNSIKTDAGANFENNSGKLKLFGFGSYTRTHTNLQGKSFPVYEPTDDSGSEGTGGSTFSGKSNNDSYSFYGAGQYKFNNGDILTGSAYTIKDGTLDSKTTSFDVNYYWKIYMALVEATTTTYDVTGNSVTVTNLTCSFNPELADNPKTGNAPSSKNSTKTLSKENNTTPAITKRCSTEFSPFVKSLVVAGSASNGVGGKFRSICVDKDSKLKVVSSGLLSTTQVEKENSRYHLTGGLNVKYTKNTGENSKLTAEIDVKDRYTFGHDNIFTAAGHASYATQKWTFELDLENISIAHSDEPSYRAAVGKIAYNPNDKLSFKVQGAYGCLVYPPSEVTNKISNSYVQAGVSVCF